MFEMKKVYKNSFSSNPGHGLSTFFSKHILLIKVDVNNKI